MYYLTKLFLNAAAIRNNDIRDAYSLHRVVYSLFPLSADGEKHRILYADKGAVHGGKLVMILSDREPEFHPEMTSSTIELSENFFRFENYRFEIDLNPVRKEKESGKRRAVIGQLDLLNWFAAHAGRWGFQADTRCLEVSSKPARKFTKGGKTCTFNHAYFRGRLRVTDKELFRKSFLAGLGHGKAFGFGLLCLAPYRSVPSEPHEPQN